MVGPCPCGTYHSNGQQCCSAPLAYYSPYDDAGDYSPSVDCTLSLGTPATRRSSEGQDRRTSGVGDFQHQYNSSSSSSSHSKAGGHPLLARRCANCDTTSTPLWRNGPRGPKSLCNACGIRYKKEERRATAAAAANAAAASGGGGFTDSAGYYQYFSPPAAMGNEYGYMDDQADGRDSDSGTQFVTWRYDVTGQAYHQPCP